MNIARLRLFLKDGARFCRSKIPERMLRSAAWREEYDKTAALLAASKEKSLEEHLLYQKEKLREIISYAYENVPYYKELFDKNGIDPDSIREISDLERIPLLTKDIIKKEGDRMLSRAIPRKNMVSHETGGSSGKPAKFYFEKDLDAAREAAFVDHIYSRIGYSKKERLALFGDSSFLREASALGLKSVSKKMPGSPLWAFPYTKIEMRIDDYIRELSEIDPQWLCIVPSALYRLTMEMRRKGIENPMKNLKGIFLKSETLYPYQKEAFRSFYRTKILHVYGHTEHACMAGTCEEGLRFHVQPEYGIAEFLSAENGKSELVATGFHNKAMPLIRYQTRDLFTLSDEPCPCGRHYQMIDSIEGRATDFLYLKNGMVVSDIFCDFTTEENAWLSSVALFQIEQREKGKCLFKVVPMKDVTPSETLLSRIQRGVASYFFGQMDVEVVVVDSIPRTGRGKEKLILSLVDSGAPVGEAQN